MSGEFVCLLLGRVLQELNRLIHESGGGGGGEQGGENKGGGEGLVPLSFTKPLKQLEVEFVSTLLLQKDVFSQLKQNKCLRCPLREQHMKVACRKREVSLPPAHHVDRTLRIRGRVHARTYCICIYMFVERL